MSHHLDYICYLIVPLIVNVVDWWCCTSLLYRLSICQPTKTPPPPPTTNHHHHQPPPPTTTTTKITIKPPATTTTTKNNNINKKYNTTTTTTKNNNINKKYNKTTSNHHHHKQHQLLLHTPPATVTSTTTSSNKTEINNENNNNISTTTPVLLSTGWLQERIRAWFRNRTKINWRPYRRLTYMSNKPLVKYRQTKPNQAMTTVVNNECHRDWNDWPCSGPTTLTQLMYSVQAISLIY